MFLVNRSTLKNYKAALLRESRRNRAALLGSGRRLGRLIRLQVAMASLGFSALSGILRALPFPSRERCTRRDSRTGAS